MLIADSQNIREIIAFPKNKKARDALMGAPSIVKEQQLKDIHIQVCKNKWNEKIVWYATSTFTNSPNTGALYLE